MIAAYQRKKEQLKALSLNAEALVPTGDARMDEKRAKEYVYNQLGTLMLTFFQSRIPDC